MSDLESLRSLVADVKKKVNDLSARMDAALAASGGPNVRCGECGRPLTEVRPGKYQCDPCDNQRVIEELKKDLKDALDLEQQMRNLARQHLRERDQARAEAAAYKQDFEAELAGSAALRQQYGARENETMFDFIARMVRERNEASEKVEWPQGSTPGPWAWELDGGTNSLPYRIFAPAERTGTTARRYHALAATQEDARLISAVPLLKKSREMAVRERDEARAELKELREEHRVFAERDLTHNDELVKVEKERDLLLEEVKLLQSEVRKQVFVSKVLYDRDVVERAQLASDEPTYWREPLKKSLPPDWNKPDGCEGE